jgi:hypothetical protein
MKSAGRQSWNLVKQYVWAFTLLVTFGPHLITAWHIGDRIWLAAVFGILISVMIVAILESLYFKATAARPRAAKVITVAAMSVFLVSIFLDFWRGRQQPNGVLQSVVQQQPNAVVQEVVQQVEPAALQITPAQATQGQTMEVTITTTTPRFTPGSIPHFGPGITVLDSHNTSQQTLAARIKIDEATPPGNRRIWVTTRGPEIAIDDSPRGAFSVVAGVPAEK